MRTIDDGIIYKLNNSVPTASFADQVDSRKQCKELYDQVYSPACQLSCASHEFSHPLPCLQLQEVYKLRTRAIQNCISETSQSVLALKERRDADRGGSADIVKELRKEQTKVTVHVYTCVYATCVIVYYRFLMYSLGQWR